MRIAILFATLSLFGASPPPPEPWKWSTEQRIAVRFDRNAQRQRAAESAGAATFHATTVSGADATLPGDVLDGRTHPELFFPTELFDRFVKTLYADRLTNYRESIQQHSDDVLRDDEEWDVLQKAVAPYAENLAEDLRLYLESYKADRIRRREIEARLEQLRAGRCALEKEAFRRVHRAFGAERFDRFLYVVVAGDFSTGYSSDHDFAATRRFLVEREENCR